MDSMPGMDGGMDSGMNGGMMSNNMNMVFYSSTTTPLYGSLWTPTSTGSYAGTCLFLITLAVLFSALRTAGYIMDKRNIDIARNRRYIIVAGQPTISEQTALNPDKKEAVLISEQGAEETVRVVTKKTRTIMPWRLSTDLPRALLNTAIAGVGYLLMLAVMTMNIGYFCSVLAGVFISELALGRFTKAEEH
ncbi:MAG: hypothetical protein GOMPHAMPRED_005793 [Gomphillus americanus]|uniref:Copper transport protein n=1 Tax=Gomphillus americanus TaxID=1940652 RepID=A0A8H3IT74_9LECA|nr:MAG: hypothetical protein GOMPHAMPRED_005793 [Gomphillus americanus]